MLPIFSVILGCASSPQKPIEVVQIIDGEANPYMIVEADLTKTKNAAWTIFNVFKDEFPEKKYNESPLAEFINDSATSYIQVRDIII